MAKPIHGVILHRYESAATGGDQADKPKFRRLGPLEAGEDAPYVQGVFFIGPTGGAGTLDKLVYISRDTDGNLCFGDVATGMEYSLEQLASGALPPATKPGQVLFSCDGTTFNPECPITSCEGWLTNDCGDLLVEGF